MFSREKVRGYLVVSKLFTTFVTYYMVTQARADVRAWESEGSAFRYRRQVLYIFSLS